MEEKQLKINNLLEVFAEAEDKRTMGTLPGMKEEHMQFMCKYFVGKKEVARLQNQINIVGAPKVSEILRLKNLTSAEILIFNSSLKNLMEGMIVDMISHGVIVLEIKDGTGTSELTLTYMAANPKPSVKRIDIKR